jgi:hypothetical protein
MGITKSFVKEHAPTDGMVRVNHNENGCIGDSDSCVIRNEGGRISAKCYRCGGWQVIDSDSFNPAKVSSVIKRNTQLPSMEYNATARQGLARQGVHRAGSMCYYWHAME